MGAFDLQTQDLNLGRKDFVEKMNIRAKEMWTVELWKKDCDFHHTNGDTYQEAELKARAYLNSLPDVNLEGK